MPGDEPRGLNPMPTDDEHILRILGEATEPLFPSEITDRLNRKRGIGAAHTMTKVVLRLKSLASRVAQLPDGRWTLNRRRFERVKQ
jgi:hypothetical protein